MYAHRIVFGLSSLDRRVRMSSGMCDRGLCILNMGFRFILGVGGYQRALTLAVSAQASPNYPPSRHILNDRYCFVLVIASRATSWSTTVLRRLRCH